jgi:hypothetical protein
MLTEYSSVDERADVLRHGWCPKQPNDVKGMISVAHVDLRNTHMTHSIRPYRVSTATPALSMGSWCP